MSDLTLDDKVGQLLEQIVLLSDWESDFLEDIQEKLHSGQKLSAKQVAKVEQIYHKVNS